MTSRWAVTSVEHISAALLVRVWLEEGSDGFRARVTALSDSAAQSTLVVTSSPSDVIDAVREWLEVFTSGTGRPIDSN